MTDTWWSVPVAEGVAETVVARLLTEGRIVGWAQGRLEFGPRALGNRSILADPRDRGARDRVNAAVKFREEFRPLAPAVMAERADDWFVVPPGTNMRHMTVAVPVRPGMAERIAAVVHDDGTAQVQAVHRADNPRFWRILNEFERLTDTRADEHVAERQGPAHGAGGRGGIPHLCLIQLGRLGAR